MLAQYPQQEQARELLHIVLATVRPLTLRETNMALNIEKGQKSREEVDLYPQESFGTPVKNLFRLLVTIFDTRIYFLQQTVRDFLLPRAMTTGVLKQIDSGGVWKHSMVSSESNLVLANRCLYRLSLTVFDDDLERSNFVLMHELQSEFDC